MIFFGSSTKKTRRPSSSSRQARQFPPAGLRGDEQRKAEGPFPSPPSGKPGAATRPGLQAKGKPQPHTPARQPASLPCCHIPVLCPAKQIFLFSCRHRSPLFPGTSKVVPTSDRDDSPKCRSCRHTNPHSIGISRVVPTLVVTLSSCRVQPRLYNQPSRMSSHKPGLHRHFYGGRTRHSPATRAKSQNAQPEMETSIPQALLTAHVAKTSMAQALPLPPRGPTSRRKGSSPHRVARPGQFPHCKTPAPIHETGLHTEKPVAVGLMRRTAEGKTQT